MADLRPRQAAAQYTRKNTFEKFHVKCKLTIKPMYLLTGVSIITLLCGKRACILFDNDFQETAVAN